MKHVKVHLTEMYDFTAAQQLRYMHSNHLSQVAVLAKATYYFELT